MRSDIAVKLMMFYYQRGPARYILPSYNLCISDFNRKTKSMKKINKWLFSIVFIDAARSAQAKTRYAWPILFQLVTGFLSSSRRFQNQPDAAISEHP